MTSHSNLPPAIEHLRKTLLLLELELLECDAQIALHTEKCLLFSQSQSKKETKQYLISKVYVENYTHYRKRITQLYNSVIDKLNSISARYEGKFDKVFSLYFLQRKSLDEVINAVKNDYTPKQVKRIIAVLQKDLENF
jgi:hypothetical protein